MSVIDLSAENDFNAHKDDWQNYLAGRERKFVRGLTWTDRLSVGVFGIGAGLSPIFWLNSASLDAIATMLFVTGLWHVVGTGWTAHIKTAAQLRANPQIIKSLMPRIRKKLLFTNWRNRLIHPFIRP